MNLEIGSVNDYDNIIQRTTDDMKIGPNAEVNSSRPKY